jgi:hypothetical protein
MLPLLIPHSAQAQVDSHQSGQHEGVWQPVLAFGQVDTQEDHGNRPDERGHEAAERNEPTQLRVIVVLVELGLLPLPLGNLCIRAVFLVGPKR